MFLTEDEVLMGYKDTDQNISERYLTLWSGGGGIVWWITTRTRVNHCCHFLRQMF